MRILHISAYYYPAMVGGAEHHLQRISEELARRGHDVTVLTTKSSSLGLTGHQSLKSSEVINGVKVKRFNAAGYVLRSVRTFLRMRGSHWLLRRLISRDSIKMLKQGPLNFRAIAEAVRISTDLVAVMNWIHSPLAFQGCLIKRIKRVPLVAIPLFHTRERWSQSPLFPKMLAHCDAILANTEHEKRFIEARTFIQPNVHAVGVGIDPHNFSNPEGQRIRARYGIDDAPVVGYVGRLQPTKGVVTLIEAMKIIWRSNPEVYLLLAGRRCPRGWQADREFEQALAGVSPTERARVIHIDGFADKEKASIFDAMDIFAMPSIAESFGITYLEAWMCRKPVIGARIGSTQCVIQDGVDGTLVNPNKPEEIAKAILELLEDPVRRKSMGELGYEKTISQFTWEKITDKVERLYLDLLVNGPEPPRMR